MRGIVMEIEAGNAVVMKNNGIVDTVRAKPGWQAGDVVPIPARVVPFKALASIAACLVLAVGLLAGFTLYHTQTTLVSIDVNPSIELSINRFDRVIAARSLNPEAEPILEDLPLKNLPYTEAVALLMENEVLDGYIVADALLVFSVQSDDATRQEVLLAELAQAADSVITGQYTDATTEYMLVDGEEVAAAHGHGMSAGKYKLVQELAEYVPDLDMDDYSHHSVTEIQGEIKAHRHRYGQNNSAAQGNQDADGQSAPNGQGNKNRRGKLDTSQAAAAGEGEGGGHGGYGHQGGRH